jgi:hypothetical protein
MNKSVNSLLAGLIGVCASLSAVAAPGELWEITSKMEMEGMPMAMPAQTQQACLPKDKKPDSMVPKNESSDCKMTEQKQVGNKMTFKMACSGKDPMTGSGEITSSGNTYSGKMQISGKMEGESIDMKQSFSGKKLGSCEYTPVKDTSKEQIAEACRKAMDNFEYPLFTMDGAMCQSRKAEFCGRVKKLTGEMSDPDRYVEVAEKQRNWKEAANACGQDTSAVMAKACKTAVDKKRYQFVGTHCEAEALALGPQLCEGRSYTSAMSGEHSMICHTYFEKNGDPRVRSASSDSSSSARTPQEAATEAASNPADAVQKGVKALKGLLNF